MNMVFTCNFGLLSLGGFGIDGAARRQDGT